MNKEKLEKKITDLSEDERRIVYDSCVGRFNAIYRLNQLYVGYTILGTSLAEFVGGLAVYNSEASNNALSATMFIIGAAGATYAIKVLKTKTKLIDKLTKYQTKFCPESLAKDMNLD